MVPYGIRISSPLAKGAHWLRLGGLAVALAVVGTTGAMAQAAAPLTGGNVTGPVTLRMVSCCKPTYFGPAVDKWNASNPDIRIEQEVIPFAQLNDILEARLRSRDASFDIVIVDPPRTASSAARKQLVDLTDSVGPAVRATTNPESLVATSFRDRLYAVPVFNSTQILIYNPDLLAKAGIALPSIDPSQRVTWEKVIQDAQTVKERLGTSYGIAFSQGQSYYQLQPIIMSGGGEVGLSGDNMMTPKVDTAAWKKVLGWWGGLYERGLAPRGVPFTQMDSLFTSGRVPFLVTSTDRVREFQTQKLNFGVAAFPYFEGGKAYTPCDSFALGLNPFSAHQSQAAKFLTWLAATKEGGFAAAAESPNVPANLLVRDAVSQQMEDVSPNLKGLTDLIRYETSTTCVHRPQSIAYVAFETAFTQNNLDIVNGADASSVLDKMQSQLQANFSRLR